MAPFFPRHTIEWKLEEPRFVRRLAVSLIPMGILTGILAHAYRWIVLTHRPGHWWLIFVVLAGHLAILLGLTTAHLGNHPVRQWVWRAPMFALVVSVTESVLAALLIAAGVERIGTTVAQWNDWRALSLQIFLFRESFVLIFALILAAVVQWVRFVLLKREHRLSTAMAMHEVREEEDAAKRAR